VHEFRNHLQSIIVGLDLMQLTQDDSLECQQMRQEIQRACRLLQEVQEYFFPPPWSLSAESLAAIVREVVQRKQDEWHSQDIRLRVICHDPPSALQLDWRQVQSALERVLAFARALLSQGGMLEVTAQMRKQSGQPWIELKVISSAVTALEVEEQDVFQPFLRVNDYQLGLSLTLVHQMVDRQHGRVSFRKTNPRRGCFTLLLKAFPS
jgi:K+-sensing histidine kinase KdpD